MFQTFVWTAETNQYFNILIMKFLSYINAFLMGKMKMNDPKITETKTFLIVLCDTYINEEDVSMVGLRIAN